MFDIPLVTSPIFDVILPENVKLLAPFPSIPLLTIYETVTSLAFGGFLPKRLSPKIT